MPDRLPKRKRTGEPLRRFQLLAGVHCDAGGTKKKGDIIDSELDLVAIFGRDKFRPLFKYGDDQDYGEQAVYETEVGMETADELAARIRAQVLSEFSMPPRQCHMFGDCLLPDGHKGPCGFSRPENESVKAKPAPYAPLESVANKPKQSPKLPTGKVEATKPLSNVSEAPKTQPTKVKSPTSQFDAYSEEELRALAADEEVDVTGCKTKEDLVKALANVKV